MLGVMGMLTVVAVLWVRVLVRVRGVRRELVELRVGGRVVVVVVVVGRWILGDLAVVGMVTVVLGLHCVCDLCCVVQVGRVGLVGYEGRVAGRGQRRVALRRWFPTLAAKKRPQDGSRCRVWDGGVAARGALVWRSGSSARVGTANDGPLQMGKRGNSMSVRAAKAELLQLQATTLCISDKRIAKCLLGMQMRNSKNVFMVGSSSNARNESSLESKELCC